MADNKEKDYIDVDEFEDLSNEINGKPLFYTTMQVAGLIDVPASTIRFWSKRFENLLDVEISNRNRQYKKSDIAKLSFIKKLSKDDGLTLQQVEDYVSKKGFDMQKAIVEGGNPLAIQSFITAMTVEMDRRFEEMQEKSLDMQRQLQEITLSRQEEMNKRLQEGIIATVDEVVSEKLDSTFEKVKLYMDKRELDFKEKDTEIIDALRENMRLAKENYESQLAKDNHKLWLVSWFQKLFHKNK